MTTRGQKVWGGRVMAWLVRWGELDWGGTTQW
jgi:hypothetical protein